MNHWHHLHGECLPLGATWVEAHRGFNFALVASHATAVAIELYAEREPAVPVARFQLDPFLNRTEAVWHCFVPESELRGATCYAYFLEGPSDPAQGLKFYPEKVILDPWARGVYFPPGHSRAAAIYPGSNRGRAPLGRLPFPESFDWGDDRPPRNRAGLIIYELHVRGFTVADPSVPPDLRGTFLGVAHKVPYLLDLGVNAVELMPVHQFDPAERNYWGYMPLNFFTPHSGYCAPAKYGTPQQQFKAMVKALHAAGIEVLLDVVYNHTTEGDASGPVYSLKGIDAPHYYLIGPGGVYRNDTGTGNTLRAGYSLCIKLILDSLLYWAQEMRVDGFRFDLATILARDEHGNYDDFNPPLIGEITRDPVLGYLHMIAEPWDLGEYRLGSGFRGHSWMQWNGQFRDEIKRFVRGDAGMVGRAMARIYGSADLFPDDMPHCCRPHKSVNYICSHDGFTLYDQVSYNKRHNEANGEKNRDGHGELLSWNCGHEGDVGAPADVLRLRRRQARNFFAILLLSNGTPMIGMGDEFLRTQGGNNNPYNQDNPTTWVDWNRLDRERAMFRFVKEMIAFRKRHPILAPGRFWREHVRWHGAGEHVDFSDASRQLSYHLRSARAGGRDLFVALNMSHEPATFAAPEGAPEEWRLAVDTAADPPRDIVREEEAEPLRAREFPLAPRSVKVLVRMGGGGPPPAGGDPGGPAAGGGAAPGSTPGGGG